MINIRSTSVGLKIQNGGDRMKEFFSNTKFKNPYFWLSTFALIFTASGIDFVTLTSWPLLGEALVSIVQNPVSIVAVITAFLGIWNDNSTFGMDRLKNKK